MFVGDEGGATSTDEFTSQSALLDVIIILLFYGVGVHHRRKLYCYTLYGLYYVTQESSQLKY